MRHKVPVIWLVVAIVVAGGLGLWGGTTLAGGSSGGCGQPGTRSANISMGQTIRAGDRTLHMDATGGTEETSAYLTLSPGGTTQVAVTDVKWQSVAMSESTSWQLHWLPKDDDKVTIYPRDLRDESGLESIAITSFDVCYKESTTASPRSSGAAPPHV